MTLEEGMVCYILGFLPYSPRSNSPWMGPWSREVGTARSRTDSPLQAWQQEAGSGTGAGQPGSGQVTRPQ